MKSNNQHYHTFNRFHSLQNHHHNLNQKLFKISIQDNQGAKLKLQVPQNIQFQKVHQKILAILNAHNENQNWISFQSPENNAQQQKLYRNKKIWFQSLQMDYLFDYRFHMKIGELNKNINLLVHGISINQHPLKQKKNKNKNRYSIPYFQYQKRRLSSSYPFKNKSQEKIQNRNSRNQSVNRAIKTNLITNIKQQSCRKNNFKIYLQNKLQENQKNLLNYRIIKCISVGGFSKVYLVRSKVNGNFYAAKFIDKQKNRSKTLINLIYNERDINNMVNHPFIIKMQEFLETDNFFIFIMEYCPGGQLFNQLKNLQKITQQQAKIYFIEVLLAVQHLHKNSIVFRDIKPQNILIDHQGHVKLTDFGLAKILSKRQKTFSYCGSVQYMAPQIILNQGHSFQVDFYCMGILLYEIIMGYPPFYDPNQSSQQIKASIVKDEISFPNNINLSGQIKDFIWKLLRKQPKQRLGYFGGANQLIMHPWIGKLKTDQYLSKKIVSRFKPNLNILNFDESQFGQSQLRFSKKVADQIKRQISKYPKENLNKLKHCKSKSVQKNYTNSLYKSSSKNLIKRENIYSRDNLTKNRGSSFNITPKYKTNQFVFKDYNLNSTSSVKSFGMTPFISIQQKIDFQREIDDKYLIKNEKLTMNILKKIYGQKKDNLKCQPKLKKVKKNVLHKQSSCLNFQKRMSNLRSTIQRDF